MTYNISLCFSGPMESKQSSDSDPDFVPANKRRKTSPSPGRGGRGSGRGKNRGRGKVRGKNRGSYRGSYQNLNMSIPRGMPTNNGQTSSRGTNRGNPKCTYSPRLEYPDVPMSEPGRSSSANAVEKKISDQDLGQSKTEHLRIPNFLERENFTNEAKSESNAAKDSHPNERVVLIVNGISHDILAKDLKEEQIRAVQFLQHSIRDHPVTAPCSNPDEFLDFKCPTDIKATTTSSLGASKVQLSEDKPGREIIACPTSRNPATSKLTEKINHIVMLMALSIDKFQSNSNYNQMLNLKRSFLERCAKKEAEDKPGREIIVCPTSRNAATYHAKKNNCLMRIDQNLDELQSKYNQMLNQKRSFLERCAKKDEENKPGREIIVCPTSHTATYKLAAKRNHIAMGMAQNLDKLQSNYNQMLIQKRSFLERCAKKDEEDKTGREIIVCPTSHNAATYHLTVKRKNIVMRMDQKLAEFQSNHKQMVNDLLRFLERWAINDEKEAEAQRQAKAASEASLAAAAECGKPITLQVAVDTPPSPRTAPATTFPKTASKAVQTEVEKPKQIPNKETPDNVNISTFGSVAHSPSCTSVTSSFQDLEFSNMSLSRNLETENFTVQSANVLSNNVVIQMEHNESSVSDNSQQTDAQGFEDAAG